MFKIRYLVLFAVCSVFLSCNRKDDEGGNAITRLFFPASYDVYLGQQLKAEIESGPDQYPILDSVKYPEAYGHLYRLRDSILNTGVVNNTKSFSWQFQEVLSMSIQD